ncbi:Imm31 family immunity protein [Frischella perrara]|uniref:Immunity protein 17 n=1 Tax=Frischella perrara TaxID=1267021 RepID=A0A0A7S9I4_FRIPE|nr:Imm31 family immunity protein [Frischella perrara]AJA45956.1 Immunity protein 17 [Frischella perrara]PWV58566.1 immunity protein 31 of polymorphic toxin system [Frischella perrara]
MTKFDFYQEVEILPNCPYAEYIGKKGVIMGISEEDGIIYSYAVSLLDGDYEVSLLDGDYEVSLLDGETGLCFSPDCLKPTGKQFKRENFY